MLEWLGPQEDAMRVAFTRVFGSRYEPFGSVSLRVGGYSDNNNGVQWNVAYDPDSGTQWVGVNLEGMKYDGWPIGRLIERELESPSLLDIVRDNQRLRRVSLLWRRDYWQANSRPDILERQIHPTPIPLEQLTAADWKACLEEAQGCLDGRRSIRGRAVQTVTLKSGQQVEGEVSPHLTFEYFPIEPMDWEPLMRAAKECMQPLYDWTRERSSKPIRF